jgi:hypothetical protein
LEVGTNTDHPKVSGLNVGSAGVLLGGQGVHLTAYNTNKKGAIGYTGANSIILTAPTVTFDGCTDLQIGGKSGWNKGHVTVDDYGGTGAVRMYFVHGILVDVTGNWKE